MISHLQQIRKERLNGERGFTLTELLVVIVIIGILVAIAIPVFLSQREAAWARSAEADARNAVPAIEAWYSNTNEYPDNFTVVRDGNAEADTTPGASGAPEINVSPGVTLTYELTAGSDDYTVTTEHQDVDGREWLYTSSSATLVEVP